MIQTRLQLRDSSLKSTIRKFLDNPARTDLQGELDLLQIELIKSENTLLRLVSFDAVKGKTEAGLEQQRADLSAEVASLSVELVDARQTKEWKQEYETVAARIQKYGGAGDGAMEKARLEDEIRQLEDEAAHLENNYSLNLNKLHTVLHLLEDLALEG